MALSDVTTISDLVTEGEAAWSNDQDNGAKRRETIMAAVNIIFGVFGMLGNALVLFVLFRYTNMRTKVTNLFIINQSILDFLTATFLFFTTIFPADGRVYNTLSDDVYCRIWVGRIPLWMFLHMSTFNLVALTLERYFSVVHPILHKMSFTRSKAIIAIVAVWVIGLIWDIAGSVSTAKIEDGQCKQFLYPNAQVQQAVGLLGIFIVYFIPIFILIFCYSRMAYTLTKNMKKVAPAATKKDGQQKDDSPQARGKRNVIRTFAIVSTVFILCVSWNQWFFFLFNLGVFNYTALFSDFYFFSVVAMFANCCINPIIYTAKYEEFRRGLGKMFSRCKCACCVKKDTKEPQNGGKMTIESVQDNRGTETSSSN